LHVFVKPVLDADTRRLPTSIIQGLTERFCEISHFRSTDFVVYHTDDFNYFNVKLSVLKPNIDQISSPVNGPTFPQRLGLIGIPCSQASSLFMNCLIPHELGHYAFGELSLGNKFGAALEQELIDRLGSTITSQQRLWLVYKLAFWAEEIFCDLFAVRLVGFCFTFAFVELFDAAAILDENSAYSPDRSMTKPEFSQYPPDLFRLRQQVAVLVEDGWWTELTGIDSHYVRTLEAAVSLKDGDFRFTELPASIAADPKVVLSAFFAVVPRIQAELNSITAGLKVEAGAWKEADKEIALYLQNGIVPSAMKKLPDTVSLLNASYKFYLEGLDLLLAKIKDADPSRPVDRAKWTKKVESWTAKAIEDVFLMSGKDS
jgi:hypothetical protein